MYRSLFKFVKNKIPRISSTELIALRSGNTSLDRQILQGKVNFPKKIEYTQKFPEDSLNELFDKFDN